MVFGIKRKKDNTSDTWRENNAGDSTERKAFKEDSQAQDKIFGTWKEDKNQTTGSEVADTWEEDK